MVRSRKRPGTPTRSDDWDDTPISFGGLGHVSQLSDKPVDNQEDKRIGFVIFNDKPAPKKRTRRKRK